MMDSRIKAQDENNVASKWDKKFSLRDLKNLKE